MPYRFFIFGAGAIGTYIGFHLLKGNHKVVFLEREKDASEIERRGLSMDIQGKGYHIPAPKIVSDLNHLKQESYDLAIMAVKAYHLREIISELETIKESLPPILSLLNGVESEHILGEYFGHDKIIPGTVTTAVDRKEKGVIVVQRVRGVGVAGDHPLVPEITKAFNQSGLTTEKYHRSDDMKWSKLILNQLGNASAAILNMSPAAIFKDPDLFRMEREAILETVSVMEQQNIKVVNLPGIPVVFLISLFKYLHPALSQPLLSNLLGKGRGVKKPSFHIDLDSGKGKCEVNHLNGAVARAGKSLNCPTPVNSTLTRILMDLISKKESTDKYDHNPQLLMEEISNFY
jgi:2-dehydropantoate 2-reductase